MVRTDTCLEPNCSSWLLRAWQNPNEAIHRICRGSPLTRPSPHPSSSDLPGKSTVGLAITSCFIFPTSRLYFQRSRAPGRTTGLSEPHLAPGGGPAAGDLPSLLAPRISFKAIQDVATLSRPTLSSFFFFKCLLLRGPFPWFQRFIVRKFPTARKRERNLVY